jgi:hypothetical protein
MWWLEHRRSFVPIGRLYVKSGQTKPFGRLAPRNPSHISSSPIPFFHRTAPDESTGSQTSKHEVKVSSRRQLHREPPRRRVHPRVDGHAIIERLHGGADWRARIKTRAHLLPLWCIHNRWTCLMTCVADGHSMLLHAWQIHGRWRWRTNDGGSAPSLTATLSSTSTRGDGDLVGLMHVDGDERRRP